VKQRSDDLDIKQPARRSCKQAFSTNAIAGAALLRMIPIDLQSSRSVPPSKRFAAIPIGGYSPAVLGLDCDDLPVIFAGDQVDPLVATPVARPVVHSQTCSNSVAYSGSDSRKQAQRRSGVRLF
jgi:hypothetical protein